MLSDDTTHPEKRFSESAPPINTIRRKVTMEIRGYHRWDRGIFHKAASDSDAALMIFSFREQKGSLNRQVRNCQEKLGKGLIQNVSGDVIAPSSRCKSSRRGREGTSGFRVKSNTGVRQDGNRVRGLAQDE